MATATVAKQLEDKRTPEQRVADKQAQESVREDKTPTQIASEAVLKDEMLQISGTSYSQLEKFTRYQNQKKIYARGEVWFKKNFDVLLTATMESLINSRVEQLEKQLKKAEDEDKSDAFKQLVARGVKIEEAYRLVYGK